MVDYKKLKTTFVVNELFDMAKKEFQEFYLHNADVLDISMHSYAKMYDLYDCYFRGPLESSDCRVDDKVRSDFYKAIDIMLFSFYKVWCVALRNGRIDEFNAKVKPEERKKCIDFFYDNMRGSHKDILRVLVFDDDQSFSFWYRLRRWLGF